MHVIYSFFFFFIFIELGSLYVFHILYELHYDNGVRTTVHVAGKQIKSFKKRCEPELDPGLEEGGSQKRGTERRRNW